MKRETDNDRLPHKVIAYVVIVVITELNFLRLGGSIAAVAGQNGWLAILVAGLGLAGSAYIIVTLMRMFPGKSLVEIATDVLGRFLGTGVVVFYIVYWILRSGVIVHLQSHLFSRQLLPDTPEMLLSLYMVVLSSYLVRHGFEPMARLFWVLVFVYVFSLLPLVLFGIGAVEFGRLKPVLHDGMLPVLHGAWVTFVAGPGAAVLLMLSPLFTDLKGALRSALGGVAWIILPGAFLNVLLVGHFGPLDMAEMTWSTMTFARTVETPGFTGLRLDPIFLTSWSLMIFGTVSILQYAAVSALRRLFRAEDNLWLVVATGASLAAVAFVPISPPDLVRWVEGASEWTTPAIIVVFPALLLIVGRMRAQKTSAVKGGGR